MSRDSFPVRAYKGWTCGGSIVSPEYILTSAACVEDVKFMYAIAGYKKFVEYEKIDLNNCTKQIERWAYTDIALAKVETAFDFKDASYLEHQCSYIPAIIQINYEQSDKKGLLIVEPIDTRPDNGHREYEYNKNTGV
ncbi:Uncharacterized protein OBRU01_14217, partial [Operophtera brumata]